MPRFCRFDLRTTDADAARAFYQRVLGHDRSSIWTLHEQARARGARPHWLGHIGVEDPERTAAAFIERGAAQLGPTRALSGGGVSVVVRDPGGAIVALSTPSTAPVDVAWHTLNASDVVATTRSYVELFGWALGEHVDLGEHGRFQPFAWSAGEPNVGAIGSLDGRPGVHPHWIFVFEVDDLEGAAAEVRRSGGIVLAPITQPNGGLLYVCDDPQGAAFALRGR